MTPAHAALWADFQPGPHARCDVSAVLPRARAWVAVLVGGVVAVVFVVWSVLL